MYARAAPHEPTVVRRVSPSWSITIPATFDESFVHGDDNWHAWEDHPSISLDADRRHRSRRRR
jgi:hypothetical protein